MTSFKLCISACLSGVALAACLVNESVGTDNASMDANIVLEETEGFPEELLHLIYPTDTSDTQGMDQVIAMGRLWEKGRTLKVCFFGGTEPLHTLIETVAREWEEPSGLRFDFGSRNNRRNCNLPRDGFSQIRISFSSQGYYSTVGKDSEISIFSTQPSMNLSRFHMRIDPRRGHTPENVMERTPEWMKGIVRHEFGHAIGLLHEHQNRNLGCWNELRLTGSDNVYDWYWRKYGWSRPKVEKNLGQAVRSFPTAQSGEIDPDSIMRYIISDEILIDGKDSKCYFPERSTQISALDKAYVTSFYRDVAPEPPNDVDDLPNDMVLASSLQPRVGQDDYVTRILTDLEANDVSLRRDARVRLAREFTLNPQLANSDRVKNAIGDQSYRQTLGIVVALTAADGPVPLDLIVKERLNNASDKFNDPTLDEYVELARQR